MATTVFTMPMAMAEETQVEAKEYFYHFNDFESLTNDEVWLSTIEQGRAMAVENGANVIDGNQSLKVTSNGVGWVGVGLSGEKVPAGVTARVSFNYKVTVGTKDWGGVGYIGFSKNTTAAGVENVNYYNWSNVHNNSYTEAKIDLQAASASSTVLSFKGTLARKGTGNYPVGVYYKDISAPSEVIFDNVKIAEIIETVAAVSDNEAKGTVTVANKEAKYTDYAMYETAVFTATPNEGYSFKGWYNGDELVSTDAVYEHTLTGDTTLTAKWKLYEKEYFYHFNDFESLTNDEEWLAQAKQGTTMSVENGANVISGSQSLKTTTSGDGYSGFALSDVGVGKNMKTRVSFDYKVTDGTKDWSGVGYIGHAKAVNSAGVENINCYNWSNVNGEAYSNKVTAGISNTYAASATVRSFKDTFTRKDSGAEQPFGIFMNDQKAPLEVIFDNVKIAEIIETVAAVSADEAKGTAAVANKETKYTDYAKNEIAVFTATPNEGYSFKGWYNAEGELVSTSATYEHTLISDTTLTAEWKLYEKEYDYKAYDYENMTDTDAWFATARDSVMSFETANPISGNSSLKITASKTGYVGVAVIPSNVSLKSATNYRMTASTRVTAGVFNYGRIGSATTSDGTVNPWNIGTGVAPLSNGCVPFVLLADNWSPFSNTMSVRTVTSTMTTATSGALVLGSIFSVSEVDENSVASILIDNFVAAEIIETVSATSADAAMGSASVVNKAGYDDYAKNEVAVFTATPNKGYYLEGWYDANGEKVSSDKVYEATLTTDTNLTAKFAAYDKLVNVSFNTNGGNKIDTVSDGEGADIVLPTPVKAGYIFAGWYTDADLTNRFIDNTIPAEDITLYAKWIVGAYQDFENYTSTPSGNFTVMNDGENAYLGNGYIKYNPTAKDNGSRLIVSDTALKEFAAPGDKIEVSFKYKLVSGDAKFYMHTSSKANAVSLTNLGKNESGSDIWLNAYKHKNTSLAAPAEEWQTLTAVYELNDYTTIANTGKGFTVNEFLYSVFFLMSTEGAELYIDEMSLNLIPGEKIKTAYNNAAALRSAESSSTGKNGLRIYNEIDTLWVENNNIVEFGSVAAFASIIDGEITVENGKKGVAYSQADEKYLVWEVKEGTVVFTSYLTNIAASRYDDDILIRSYAIAADGTVYYGETVTVSVFDVANAIDNAETADGSEQSEADAAAFYTFVTNANADAYKTWCDENGKTAGALYNNKYSA